MKRFRTLALIVLAGGLIGGSLSGCARTARTVAPVGDGLIAQISVRPGDALGSRATTLPGDTGSPASALQGRLRLYAINNLHNVLSVSSPDVRTLGSESRLITVQRQSNSVLSAPQLTRQAKLAIGAAAIEKAALADSASNLPKPQSRLIADQVVTFVPGLSVDLAAENLRPPSQAPGVDSLKLTIHRPDVSSTLVAALTLSGRVLIDEQDDPGDAETEETPATQPANATKGELTLMSRLVPIQQSERSVLGMVEVKEQLTHALLVPTSFVRSVPPQQGRSSRARASPPTGGVLVIVDIGLPTADAAHEEAFNTTLDQARQSIAKAAAVPTTMPRVADEWATYELALRRALVLDQASQRRAILFVASSTGAKYASDFTLTAQDATVARYLQLLSDSIQASNLPREAPLIGWLMDRVWLELSVRLAEEGRLSPALSNVVVLFTGQVGRDSSALADILKVSRSRPAFEARLVAENLIYLEDASPAARVRAYDWLLSHGHAPPNFDPLADARDRRAALNAFESGPAK